MRAVDIIIKKRDGLELSKAELEFFINGYTQGDIPDYQASAWAMAVLLRGMTAEETTNLTLVMANTGDTLDLSTVVENAVDKHSSGGVGDKTSIVVVPMVRACGLPVGKMSGRGLGFSGGTLDKLDSIPGFRTDLTKDEFLTQLKNLGMVLSGQSVDLAPADGKLYALRDVTGTVPSLPLIASSIMSKKIAAGAHSIVLDVKTGNGAFMKTVEDGRRLATLMVSIGELSGRNVTALISDMNQPLGVEVGNALEMKEAILTLRGEGPEDFTEHCVGVASEMLLLGKRVQTKEAAREMAENAIASGEGLDYLRKLIEVQGGDVSYIDHPEKLPVAPFKAIVEAPRSGNLAEVRAQTVGETSVVLGAGRMKKGEPIDLAVGISVMVKVGQSVEAGQPMFVIHARKAEDVEPARKSLLQAVSIVDEPVEPLPLFYGLID